MKEHSIKYNTLQEELNATEDKQINTTGVDSRSTPITKSTIELARNSQNMVDDKQNLIRQTEANNTNDGKALYQLHHKSKKI